MPEQNSGQGVGTPNAAVTVVIPEPQSLIDLRSRLEGLKSLNDETRRALSMKSNKTGTITTCRVKSPKEIMAEFNLTKADKALVELRQSDASDAILQAAAELILAAKSGDEFTGHSVAKKETGKPGNKRNFVQFTLEQVNRGAAQKAAALMLYRAKKMSAEAYKSATGENPPVDIQATVKADPANKPK